jgi:Holliday junction resolvase RusA-like endonuclease
MARYKRFKDWQTAVFYVAKVSRVGFITHRPVALNATFYVDPARRMPDRDNLQKGLSDALQGAVYLNDNQICGGAVRRLPGLPERVEVEVVELEDC